MEKNYDNIPKTIKLLIYYVKTYGAIEKKNYGTMEENYDTIPKTIKL